MAFKALLVASLALCVSAGGPASYSISAASGDHGSVGSSQEHTVKGLYGQNVVSQYSKAVDTAHSTVRVSSSRTSNDAHGYHGAALGYAGHGYAAPALGYAAHSYAAPAVKYAAPAAYGYGAHGYGYGAHGFGGFGAAPALGYASHAYAAPAYAGYHGGAAYAAPAVKYSAANAVSYAAQSLGAPAVHYGAAPAYAAPAYATPAIKYAAPALSYASPYSYGHGPLAIGSPLAHHGIAASPYGYKGAIAAPIATASVTGHGVSYGW